MEQEKSGCEGEENWSCVLCSLAVAVGESAVVTCFRTGKILEHVKNEGLRGLVVVGEA